MATNSYPTFYYGQQTVPTGGGVTHRPFYGSGQYAAANAGIQTGIIHPTATPPAPQPTAPAGGGNYDFQNDPILARISALAQQSIDQAEAEAQRQRVQLAIGYGDPNLAGQLHLDKGVADQAKGNPFGTLQELARGYKRRNVFDINRPLSDQANLFYSSERGRQLALSGEQNLRDRYQAQSAVQEKLAAISATVLQAKLAAQAQKIAAEQDAFQRAIANAGG